MLVTVAVSNSDVTPRAASAPAALAGMSDAGALTLSIAFDHAELVPRPPARR